MKDDVIFKKKLGGFGANSKYITYVTFWSQDWEVNNGMFFYPKEPSTVVDMGMDKDELVTMYLYPHNDEKLCETLAEKHVDAIYDFMRGMVGTKIVTLILEEDGIKEISQKDFTDYFPSASVKNHLFIFDDPTFGFPILFCVTAAQQTKPHEKVLGVFANASHIAFKPADKMTLFGKKLFFVLSRSMTSGKFEGDFPVIEYMKFPTSEKEHCPAFLNTGKLQKLLESAGVDKFRANSVNEVVEPEESTELEEEKISQQKEDDNNAIIPYDPLYGLDAKIMKDVTDKGMVSLSEMFTFGIEDTLSMIGYSDDIVEVLADFPGLLKKACVFQGKLHYIPSIGEDEVNDFLDTDESLVVMHTPDTFPRKI